MPALTTNNEEVSPELQKRIDAEWAKSPLGMPIEELKEAIVFAEAEIFEWKACLKMLKEVLKSRTK